MHVFPVSYQTFSAWQDGGVDLRRVFFILKLTYRPLSVTCSHTYFEDSRKNWNRKYDLRSRHPLRYISLPSFPKPLSSNSVTSRLWAFMTFLRHTSVFSSLRGSLSDRNPISRRRAIAASPFITETIFGEPGFWEMFSLDIEICKRNRGRCGYLEVFFSGAFQVGYVCYVRP